MPQRVRHPPVARVDMATVGTSMSDGQCHEAGHQVWCKKWRHAKNPLVVVLEMDFFCWFPFARLLVDTFFLWEAEAIAAIAEMAAEGRTKKVVVPISRMGAENRPNSVRSILDKGGCMSQV